MKISILFLFPALLCAGGAGAQDTLTVEQATRLVLKSHPAMAQALANAGAAEARALQGESLRYPDVSAEAQYARISPVVELTIPQMGTFKFYPENNYDAHVAARYTVFDFGRTGAMIDLGRSRAVASRDAVEMTRTGLAMQTIRTFYAILYLEKSARVQDEQIEALNGHLQATQKRVSAGTATNLDALTTKVRVAAAQSQKVDIENALQKQRSILRQLLNAPAYALLPLRGEFSGGDTASVNGDSLFQSALRQRPESALARDAEQSARLQARLAGLGRMPSLKANLSYGSKNGYIPDLNEMRANWVAGVRAEMPIWEGGRIRRQEDEAEALLLAEQAHLRDVERQIRSDVEQAAADVIAARAKVRICEVQIQQAHEATAMARSRYETGSVTNLDLLDAESAESAARLSMLQSLYWYVISGIELDRASGKRFDGD
jgi:outer membrane protein TolC